MRYLLLATLLSTGATSPALAQQGRWPLGDGVKAASKALQVPTTLAPVDRSLTDLLNKGARIVGSSVGPNGPIVTVTLGRKSMMCFVTAQNPATDQNVATSECYALN